MRRQIRGCSVTRRKSTAYHVDNADIFSMGGKDGLIHCIAGIPAGRVPLLSPCRSTPCACQAQVRRLRAAHSVAPGAGGIATHRRAVCHRPRSASAWLMPTVPAGTSGDTSRLRRASRQSKIHCPKQKRAPQGALFRKKLPRSYLMMISTRRFCGSRTPAPVGTSRWVSPKPEMAIDEAGTPSLTSSALTAWARRTDRPWL